MSIQPQRISQWSQMFFNQALIKAVMSGRHWCVSREGTARSCIAQSFVERKAVFLHPLTNDFQWSKRRVPLIHVNHIRQNPQCLESFDSANTQQQFLTNAGPLIATIQPRSQRSISVTVQRDIGIQQIQVNSSNIQMQYASMNWAGASIYSYNNRTISILRWR